MSEYKRFRLSFSGCCLLVTALAGTAAATEPRITDPTQPPGASEVAAASNTLEPWLLRSTRVGSAGRSAVVNEHAVRVGSRIDGAEVLAIEPGRVTLRSGQELITLQLRQTPVKRPAATRERP